MLHNPPLPQEQSDVPHHHLQGHYDVHCDVPRKIRLFVLKFKQESRMKKSIKQEQDENFDPKKLEIENFKQVLLCSGGLPYCCLFGIILLFSVLFLLWLHHCTL